MTTLTNSEITLEVKTIAFQKAMKMPLGTFSRLMINGEISNIVISPSSSGVYFYNVTGTIDKDILEKQISFINYNDLK